MSASPTSASEPDGSDFVLLRHLAARLDGKTPPHLRSGKSRPQALVYTEDFLAAYRRLLAVAVPRRLTRTFGWRSFHFLEDDETRRRTVADSELWADFPARFTRAGADVMWQLVTGLSERAGGGGDRVTPDRVDIAGCTEWDALVALMAWPQAAATLFTFEWLCRQRAHWIAPAFAICDHARRRDSHSHRAIIDGPPWLAYFGTSHVPFTLRFVLLEAAGDLYAWIAETLTRTAEHAEAQNFRVGYNPDMPPFDPRHPEYFTWSADAARALGLGRIEARGRILGR